MKSPFSRPPCIVATGAFLVGLLLSTNAAGQEYPTYDAAWSSLDQRYTPQWFDEAKVGVLVFWGVPSVIGYADSTMRAGDPPLLRPDLYQRALANKTSPDLLALHRIQFGRNATYADAAREFKVPHFDPDLWARLIERAGARYAIMTARLDDGFALWRNPLRWNWSSTEIGPGRDILDETLEAFRSRSLFSGIYYTMADNGMPAYAASRSRWVDDVYLPELSELVQQYRPDILWMDGDAGGSSADWQSESFLAWMFGTSRVGPHVAVNDHWGSDTQGHHGGFFTFPCNSTAYRSYHARSRRDKWEACIVLGRSMGYNRADRQEHFLSSADLIERMVDVVSHGGNLLIVMGPDGTGAVPTIVEERLSDLGDWLRVNGEAIYNTRPWRRTFESPFVWYTARGNVVYAILRSWPGRELVLEEPNPSHYSHFSLLGRPGELRWVRDEDRVRITFPDPRPNDLTHRFPTVLKMTVIN